MGEDLETVSVEFVNLAWLDLIGWAGMVGLGAFYWLLGSGKVLSAYLWGTAGAFAWLIVGVATFLGYAAQLPSLIFMEFMVIVMNIRGIRHWLKAYKKDGENG